MGTLPASAAEKLPNFVIIFADDLGYGDLACFGHPSIRTPEFDRMADEGMRFTQFYAAANICSPSRVALLTGRYPIRSGICHVFFPRHAGGIPEREITIAEALKTKGYATACVGKWHLGHLKPFLPRQHGFDYYFGLPYSNDMWPPNRGRYPPLPLVRNDETIEEMPDQSLLTKRYTDEAIRFIKQNKDKPFFVYLPHTFPHVPLFASERFKDKSPRGLYGDVVEELDWSTGEILKTLRELGLADNTLVMFTSDNGPWLSKKLEGGSAGLLREGKGTTWEGGHREPCIFWWPGKIKAGSLCQEIASTMDLLPTFLKLAGIKPPKDRIIDGRDISPLLLNTGTVDNKPFFYYRGRSLNAVRKGSFKAHMITQGWGPKKGNKHDPPLLFNLDHDPSEKYNINKKHPELIADLLKEVEAHKASIKPVENQLEKLIEKK
jgi:arylsulfatase A-like enzyme